MSDQPELLCNRCQQLQAENQRLQEEVAAAKAALQAEKLDLIGENTRLGSDIAVLQHSLLKQGRELQAVRNELARVREEEPESDDVREILGLWRDEAKGGDKRVKVDANGPRGKQVKWALKKFGKERCCDAVMGCTLDDWAMGRIRKSGGRTFNDIAKHILKDEETIERFEEMWHNRHSAAPLQQRHTSHIVPASIDEFASRIEGARHVSDSQWEGRCPAHEDRHASLRFAQGDKGIVVTCWAGCNNEAIAAAIGIPVARWFTPDAAPIPAMKSAPEALPAADDLGRWWSALQANTNLLQRLHDIKRWTPNTLSVLGVGWDQARKRLMFPVHDQTGALVNVIAYQPGGKPKSLGLRHRPRNLFPAPETYVDPGETLWLVEGEPDAITACAVGLSATGLPGVNGWRKEWVGRFSGRDVVVCFDCDAPGRKAAELVAADLVAAARSVRILDIVPAETAGYDLTDAVLEGANLAGLLLMAEECTPITNLRREAA